MSVNELAALQKKQLICGTDYPLYFFVMFWLTPPKHSLGD